MDDRGVGYADIEVVDDPDDPMLLPPLVVAERSLLLITGNY